MSKIDHHLFSAHEHAFESEPCPQCGAELVIRQGKHGPFLGCSAYPACDYIRSLTPSGRDIEKVLEGSACPDCGEPLAIKKGRYGLFVGCTQYPACQHIESLQESDDTQILCPECGKGHLVSRTSRYGKQFYSCDGYPHCKYVVNDKPIPMPCPECGWGIMVEKKVRGTLRWVCPQKKCGHQSEQV
ncbi:topoisomerase DNA-binding C4 zinc finger domain-containing protein [Aeromonas veronii]|uniref:DNA topoisomerase family protein n=1 Tax=Aeromonas veronii TaxID=654 RepID=UPI003BA0DFE3